MKSNNTTSLTALTLAVLVLIISILYIQFATDNAVITKPVNKAQVSPTEMLHEPISSAELKTATNQSTPLVNKTKEDNTTAKKQWQPALTMSDDVKKAANSVTIEIAKSDHSDKTLIQANTTEQAFNGDNFQFNPYVGLEADYANLSSSQAGQEAIRAKDAPEVEFRKTDDAAALLLNIVGSYNFDKNSSLYAKLGVNAWQFDDSHMNAISSDGKQMDPNLRTKSNIGADMFYGIGLKYDWRSFVLKSEYKIINFNGEQFESINIGGEIKF